MSPSTFVQWTFSYDLHFETYIWHKEELDSIHGTFKCQSADKKDSQHHVRQNSGDVNSLRRVGVENLFIIEMNSQVSH